MLGATHMPHFLVLARMWLRSYSTIASLQQTTADAVFCLTCGKLPGMTQPDAALHGAACKYPHDAKQAHGLFT